MRPTKSRSAFTRFTKWTAHTTGRPLTFLLACAVIVVWAVTGPLFGFSDTWQLVINTGTTVITFLMVFLIQSTQNRDSEAMQVKLDEIIRAIGGAKNELLDLEELEEAELETIKQTYLAMARQARDEQRSRHDEGREGSTPQPLWLNLRALCGLSRGRLRGDRFRARRARPPGRACA